ncbi:hypothetical protein KEM54_005231 [Ascosphaera aggregata]|nr:hypothetical protein KEM54_005231 [Ascosphaera aggregata]
MITDFWKPPGSENASRTAQRPAGNAASTISPGADLIQRCKKGMPPLRPPPITVPSFLSSEGDVSAIRRKLVPPPPYSFPLKSTPTPHPRVTVQPIHMSHLTSLQQMTSALLPVKYSKLHYPETITDARTATISRAAIYHAEEASPGATARVTSCPSDKVIGAIKCSLEPIVSTEAPSTMPIANNLYIETLLLQAPFRGNGIAKALLESILYEPVTCTDDESDDSQPSHQKISSIVKHYNIRTISAHVHESNEDALQWYLARGFIIQPVTIEGYYRKMRPSGAKIVVKAMKWGEEKVAEHHKM